MLYDFTNMSYTVQLNLQKQKVKWWLPGVGERGNGKLQLSGDKVPVLQDEKVLGDGLYNNVNIINTVHLKMIKMISFVLYVFLSQLEI